MRGMNNTLRIATRKSPLALWQSEHVAERLQAPVSYTHLTLPTICSV